MGRRRGRGYRTVRAIQDGYSINEFQVYAI